jgi:hypothetical protein
MKRLTLGSCSLLAVLNLSSHPASAQQPPALAGHYVACFTGADTARPACGTLTLAPTTSCPPAGNVSPVYDGYYSVLFSALQLHDSTRSRPANEQRFTWEAKPDGRVRFTRISFISDSLLGGETRCRISNDSDFEAWGMVAGDSIAGKWGTHIDWVGPDTLGTFILRRMPR